MSDHSALRTVRDSSSKRQSKRHDSGNSLIRQFDPEDLSGRQETGDSREYRKQQQPERSLSPTWALNATQRQPHLGDAFRGSRGEQNQGAYRHGYHPISPSARDARSLEREDSNSRRTARDVYNRDQPSARAPYRRSTDIAADGHSMGGGGTIGSDYAADDRSLPPLSSLDLPGFQPNRKDDMEDIEFTVSSSSSKKGGNQSRLPSLHIPERSEIPPTHSHGSPVSAGGGGSSQYGKRPDPSRSMSMSSVHPSNRPFGPLTSPSSVPASVSGQHQYGIRAPQHSHTYSHPPQHSSYTHHPQSVSLQPTPISRSPPPGFNNQSRPLPQTSSVYSGSGSAVTHASPSHSHSTTSPKSPLASSIASGSYPYNTPQQHQQPAADSRDAKTRLMEYLRVSPKDLLVEGAVYVDVWNFADLVRQFGGASAINQKDSWKYIGARMGLTLLEGADITQCQPHIASRLKDLWAFLANRGIELWYEEEIQKQRLEKNRAMQLGMGISIPTPHQHLYWPD